MKKNIGENKTQSKPLTFGELKIGDSFIGFPTDGDDSGHGGFRNGSYVFKKIESPLKYGLHDNKCGLTDNATRLLDKNNSHFPDSMLVHKVIF